tara:strand:+ start:23 stop:1645 length:1623 start_codon:yes stop_codon:yes gene_type:complete
MVRTKKIKLAKYSIVGKNSRSNSKRVIDNLNNYIERNELPMSAKIENNSVVVYGNDINDALENFRDKQNTPGKVNVVLKMDTPSKENDKLSGQLKTSEGKNKNLQERLTSKENELSKVKGELSSLESEYLGSLESIDGAIILEPPKDIGDLSNTLIGYERDFKLSRENLISKVLSGYVSEVEKRELLQESEELGKAREVIEGRDAYLDKYGEDALKALPETAQDATKKEWKKAEKFVEDYEIKISETKSLELPVRIAETNGNTLVLMPINPNSNNEVSKSIYETFVTFGIRMESEDNFNYTNIDDPNFVIMKLEGKNSELIEEKLRESFDENSMPYKNGIRISPFVDSFGIVDMSVERETISEITPSQEDKDGKYSSNLKEFVSEKSLELGYETVGKLINKSEVLDKGIYYIINGHYIPQNLDNPELKGVKALNNLAEALEVPLTDITSRLANSELSIEAENLMEYASERVKELGYASINDFAESTDFYKRGTLYGTLYLNGPKGKGTRVLKTKAINKLAKAFEVKSSEIREVLKKSIKK